MITIQDVLVILVKRKASEEGEWDSRFNVLFITLLILCFFTLSCHSWHLTNRWRRSEKVTTLFHFPSFFFYLSLSLALLLFFHYSFVTSSVFVCLLDFLCTNLHSLYFLYLRTCTVRLTRVGWNVTTHQWVSHVPHIGDKHVSKSLPWAGRPWRFDFVPRAPRHTDS